MIRFYKLLHWFIRIIAGLFFLIAIGFIALATTLLVKCALIFLQTNTDGNWFGLVGLNLLKKADVLLMAVVFIIFSIGILMLCADPTQETKIHMLPKWMQVSSFSDVKISLWEAILTALLISFVSALVKYNQSFDGGIPYMLLILPVCILLLALSFWFLKKDKRH